MPLAAVIILYAIGTLVSAGLDEEPYCAARYKILCQGKGTHVSCEFPDPGPGASCRNYSPIKMQDNIKHFITHYLNRRRQRIASGNEKVRGGERLPRPELMMMVEWDRELALLAQRLADQCSFMHDECRATVRYPYAGQAVGEVRLRHSQDTSLKTARRAVRRVFDAWWGERRRVTPHQLAAPFKLTNKGAVWGHFSQLAVWSLRAVGCGAVHHGDTYFRLLLVCDFSHTNMLGQRTITPGSLAPCPIHTARRSRSMYPLLCASVTSLSHVDMSESDQEEFNIETVDTVTNAEEEEEEHITTQDVTTETITTKRIPSIRISVTKILSVTPKKSKKSSKKHKSGENKYIKEIEEITETISIAYVPAHRLTTKNIFNDKLDYELEIGNKIDTNNHVENVGETPNLRSRVVTMDWDVNEDVRSTIKLKRLKIKVAGGRKKTEDTAEVIYVGRQNWKPTQFRPKRPGATALLNQPQIMQSYKPIQTRPRPAVSLTLDQEDMEQLIRDTGFNPHSWLKRRERS